MGKKKIILLLGILIMLGLGVTAWLFIPAAPEPQEISVAIPPPPPPPTAVTPPPLPVERYPITAIDASAEPVPLADLEQSDTVFSQALAKLFGEKSLSQFFYPDRMIRRFVATIDNLPRHDAPAKMMPIKPVKGAFLVERHTAEWHTLPANDQRYISHLAVMATVDPRHLVDMYVSFYPLFQRAYRELGYPDGFFNDRLIEAINDLLATPVVAPPIALEQPKVLYIYADESLEARSAGQRIMLRMGADNRAKAIKVLIAIRDELLSRSLTKP